MKLIPVLTAFFLPH